MGLNRVVITGVGAMTSTGLDAEQFWRNCLEGKSGIAPITRFDASGFSVRIAGELKGFNPEDHIDKGEARKLDRSVQIGVVTADMALKDSGLDLEGEDRDRVGVIIGSGVGGIETLEAQHTNLMTKGPSRVSPFFVPMMIVDMAAGMVSMRHRLKGPNYATVSACASGAHAISDAFRLLQLGKADVMLAGGSEAAVTPITVAGFASMKALSRRNDEPQRASRPFDRDRDGFVLGEGSGMMVLETIEHARGRGARILAELAGVGLSADAHHMTAPDPEGDGAVRAMKLALEDAGVGPADVSYINAHGTSTPYNDKIETLAIKKVFGERAARIPINSTKSMIGHLLGAGGAVEGVVCVLSMRDGVVHATANLENADPECDLDYVPGAARKVAVEVALSNSFGFGGHNVSIAFKAFQG